MADKGDYHLQKVGFTTSRGERVQVTHQQNPMGFLYGLLETTKPQTCVPSLQAERAETRPAKCRLFFPRLHLSVYDCIQNMVCVCLCVWMCMCKCVDMCKHEYVNTSQQVHTHDMKN